jgi:hypothetical protein
VAANPSFIATGVVGAASSASAYTTIHGAVTGSLNILAEGTDEGTRILEIVAQCAATSAAALVNIFVTVDGGTTWTLFDQISIAAATASATVKANRNTAVYQNLILTGANEKIAFATTVAQQTNVIALGGNL